MGLVVVRAALSARGDSKMPSVSGSAAGRAEMSGRPARLPLCVLGRDIGDLRRQVTLGHFPDYRDQRPVAFPFWPRYALLAVPAPIHDEYWLHRLPARHDEMLESVTVDGPFSVAAITRAYRNTLSGVVEPDGWSHGAQLSAVRRCESRLGNAQSGWRARRSRARSARIPPSL
jgi:hypothetical protein